MLFTNKIRRRSSRRYSSPTSIFNLVGDANVSLFSIVTFRDNPPRSATNNAVNNFCVLATGRRASAFLALKTAPVRASTTIYAAAPFVGAPAIPSDAAVVVVGFFANDPDAAPDFAGVGATDVAFGIGAFGEDLLVAFSAAKAPPSHASTTAKKQRPRTHKNWDERIDRI
jgi:hypothetical protein